MRMIFDYIKPYKWRLSLGIFFKFFGTILELMLPWILSYLVDTVILTEDINQILLWGVIMLVSSGFALLFNVIANRMAAKVSMMTTRRIRNDLFRKIMYTSSKQVDDITMPSLISRVTSDTYNVHQFVGMIQRMGIRAPILFFGGILITMTLDPMLTLMMCSVMPFVFAIVIFRAKTGMPMFRKLHGLNDRLVEVLREDIAGIRVIKALSKVDVEKERFAEANENYESYARKAMLRMAILRPSMDFLLNCGIILVILMGATRVFNGVTLPGKIIAFLIYVTQIVHAIMFVGRMISMYSRTSASGNRIDEILKLSEDIQVYSEDEYPSINTDAVVVFDDVSFSYNKKIDNLSNVSFKLKKGETLGILGATGSGKTTLAQLLLRLYDVDSGAIYIDGKDVRTYEKQELRRKFGVVWQNDFIMTDTLEQNMTFGRDVNMQELNTAIDTAQAREFVDDKGLDMPVKKAGANLSGGQKQRTLITRSLASAPEVLILDDASSALDYKTDAAFRKSFSENYKDTTNIIITQRISSIKHAEHVLVLDEGNVVAYGKMDDLLETCDIVKEIRESQMGVA